MANIDISHGCTGFLQLSHPNWESSEARGISISSMHSTKPMTRQSAQRWQRETFLKGLATYDCATCLFSLSQVCVGRLLFRQQAASHGDGRHGAGRRQICRYAVGYCNMCSGLALAKGFASGGMLFVSDCRASVSLS